jgi:hypothetical protein
MMSKACRGVPIILSKYEKSATESTAKEGTRNVLRASFADDSAMERLVQIVAATGDNVH